MSENPTVPNPAPRKNSCLVKGVICVAILALVLGGLWWWHNRPIQPVVLSAQEKTAVAAKVVAIQKPSKPKYQKGGKEIILTERELNGLLNANTALGRTVSFELATNAIHARVETDLNPDLPIIGGSTYYKTIGIAGMIDICQGIKTEHLCQTMIRECGMYQDG